MKTTLALLFVLLIIAFQPASGLVLSDRTGLKTIFPVETGGYHFDVEIVGNFVNSCLMFDESTFL